MSALQGGLLTVVPKTEEFCLPQHPHSIAQMKTASDDVVFFRNHGCYNGDPLAAIHSVMSKQEELNYMGGILGISVPSLIPKLIPIEVPSSSSKKRKHSNSAAPTEPLTVPVQTRQKHFPLSYEVADPSEGTSVREAQGVRGSQQYLWRQHMSKNPVKTVSVCSETASGSSEGSVSEGDLSSGSAVHSLLHMSRTNSSDSRGSGSGSDESDAAASDQTPTSNQSSSAHSRNHINTARIEKRAGPLALSTQNIIHTVGPSTSHSPCPPATTPKTIQAILAACESKVSPQSPIPNSNYETGLCAQNHPHWRVPERSGSHNSSVMGIMSDVRIAASTVAAVASIYPCTDAIDDPTSYLAYIPMKAIDAPAPCFQPHYDGVRNNKFTVYGGNKPHNGSVNGNSHSSIIENNNTHINNNVKMENAAVSSIASMKKKAPSISPEKIREIPQELDVKESSFVTTLKNNIKFNSKGNMIACDDKNNINNVINKNDYSLYVPYGVEIVGSKHHFHENSRDGKNEGRNEDIDDYVIKEKHTPLEHFLKAEELRLQPQPCSKAIVTGGCRLKLTDGILDCSRFKSSEIMPPSL